MSMLRRVRLPSEGQERSDPGNSALTERSARVVAAVKLHRHTGRRRAARFLAEGPHLVEAALRRGAVCEVFATEAAVERFGALLTGATVQLVTERAAKVLSDTVTPVGLVAVCAIPDTDLGAVLDRGPTLLAVPVGISEPGNAGTLIRVADAMGADAVVLAGDSVDPFNGKCVRASAGSIFSVPVISAPDAERVVHELRDAGLQVIATMLDGGTDIDDADLVSPVAWLFGPEAHGLGVNVAASATTQVRIPMTGGAESLNVASAAAICLYETARQRRVSGLG